MEPPILILVGTSHPGNVGAAARGAANFGVTKMRFVAPRCNVRAKEAMDRAVHAKPLLENAEIFDTLEEALLGLSISVGTTARVAEARNHFMRKPDDVRVWAESLKDWSGQIGLVFGREDTGLTSDEVNLLDSLVTVPTSDYASMNLAHAVTLLSYEVFRVNAESREPERELGLDTLNAMNRAWDALADTVETREWRREVAKSIFRKMIGRSRPDDHEVHNVIGILTRALKRFNHAGFKTPNSEKFLSEQGMMIGDEEE